MAKPIVTIDVLFKFAVSLIGLLGLLYVVITFVWVNQGNLDPQSAFGNIMTSLLLQGLMINAIFLLKIQESVSLIAGKMPASRKR